ncbi:MAG: Fur family transcriptional regulator [Planctomycetota bacterium]
MDLDQELQTVAEHFRQQGCRWTPQRALIVRTAFAAHDHFTADELLARSQEQDPRVSRATVYRTLAVLEAAGLVEGLDTGGGGRRFEHVLGHEHHDHMVCTACATIVEFHDPLIEARQEAAAKQHGFTIERHSLRLYGTCKKCRAQKARKGRA